MTFGEKVKAARITLNLSQAELSELTGISERSLYTYEQPNTLPRKSNLSLTIINVRNGECKVGFSYFPHFNLQVPISHADEI